MAIRYINKGILFNLSVFSGPAFSGTCSIHHLYLVMYFVLMSYKLKMDNLLFQVTGRNLILFLVILPNPEVQSEPMVCYLFLVWSAVEVFR